MKDAEIEEGSGCTPGRASTAGVGCRWVDLDEYGFMIIGRKTRLYLTGNLKTALAGFRVIIGGAVPAIPKHPRIAFLPHNSALVGACLMSTVVGATTIDFDGLSPNAPFTTYTESGFTVSVTVGSLAGV
jgi:hypothetical protein